MSKQDRQGVRTAAEIERKYDLGDLANQTRQESEKVSQLNQALAQYEANTNANIARLTSQIYPVGAVYISVNETDPTTIFGGQWEQLLDVTLGTCYLWKRTSLEAEEDNTTEESTS